MSARDPLEVVWARADAAEARFTADEVFSWPEGQEALLAEAGIIRRDSNATTVVCDACADGHVEEVVPVESPAGSPLRAYIFCPEAGRVPVPLDRLKQWVIDFGGLAKAVARSLDLGGRIEEVAPARLWALGTMATTNRRREVFLARGATWIDAPAVLGARLRASADSLLLMPGGPPRGDVWTDPPAAMTLDGVAHMEGRRLAIDRAQVEGRQGGAAPRTRRRLTREQIEAEIYATLDEIKSEAATMDEDDPHRPQTTQPTVARRLRLSRRALQDRVQLLNEFRAEVGQPPIGWEDILRGQRS